MKNIYTSKNLIKKSRFRIFFKTLSEKDQNDIKKRIDELIKENKEYTDKQNIAHLSNLLTSLAIYEVLSASLNSKEEALKQVSEAMWEYLENTTAKKYRKIFKKKGMLKLLGKLIPYYFTKGSGYGRSYIFSPETSTDNYLKFECTKCIYAQIFAKYNARELGPVFCHCDEINYGHIEGISFKREHTLCTDGKPCDFLFIKEKK